MSVSKDIRAFGESYAESVSARAAIQLIPGVGGALDTIMAGYGSKIQQERLYALIDSISKRMSEVEGLVEDIEPSEELFDLVRVAVEGSIRTRSEDKRQQFANIIANTMVSESKEWGEAETAMRLLNDLEDIHIGILVYANETIEYYGGGITPVRVVSLPSSQKDKSVFEVSRLVDYQGTPPVDLKKEFIKVSEEILRISCFELFKYGLIKNSKRLSSAESIEDDPDNFVITSQGVWFLNWITGKSEFSK
jgi:hypothetical protein